MTEPIIVPVSAPGATEASAQVRTFAGTVAQSGAAAQEAAAGHTGLAKATTASGQAAAGAAAKTQAHVRTLDEEYVRLKRAEEQALVTAAARRKLGESVNAADIGAIRRFTRGLPGGGLAREAGRGVAEGIEGAEGGGLRGGLGMAGAGIAGGVVGIELVSHAVETLLEAMDRETEARFKAIRLLEEANKRGADIGKGSLDKYGDALAAIGAGSGEAGVGKAKDFALRNGDASGIEAYRLAADRFEGPSERGLALQAAEMFHKAGGGSLKDGMEKMTPERIQRMLAGGVGMSSMVGEMFGDERGLGRLSGSRVEEMIANRAASPTAARIDRLHGIDARADLAGLEKIPQAEGSLRKSLADRTNPNAAVLTEADIAGREGYEKLQNRAQLEKSTLDGLNTTASGKALWWLYTAGKKLFGKGTANDQLNEAANEKFDAANRVMPGAEEAANALEDAAAALRGMGRGRQAQGATP